VRRALLTHPLTQAVQVQLCAEVVDDAVVITFQAKLYDDEWKSGYDFFKAQRDVLAGSAVR